MPRGRHRTDPVRRPLRRRAVAAAVGATAAGISATVMVVSLGGGPATSSATAGGAVQAVVLTPGDSATDSARAAEARRLAAAREARERVAVSRGGARPSVASVPSSATEESQTPAPSTPAEQAPPVPPPAAAAPEPQPVPEPVPAVVGQLWATTDVNVRSGPSAGHELSGHLAVLTQVDVTGATENGWTQVVTDGRPGWVNSSYLSESKPAPQAESPGVSAASCAISPSIESSLTANARGVYRAVCAAFGESVSAFGGYRPGDDGDHGSGRAVDVMVSGEPGWEIARYVQAHAAELGVSLVIYEQQIWQAGNPLTRWEYMADRGSVTANHYDHVHVSVS